MIDGIDVSAHQARTPSLEGQSFLIARATYGSHPDAMYPRHVAAARARGLVVLAYHFGRGAESIEAQVAAFLESIDRARPDGVVLDLERDGDNAPMTSSEARAFLAELRAAGWQRPGLYHSTSGYPPDALGAAFRWVADYRPLPHPPIRWDIWQWTSSGGRLDRNRFDGSRAELLGLVGNTEAPAMSRTFSLLAESTSGRVTLRTDQPHDFLRLADWSIQGPIQPGPAWVGRAAFGPVVLKPDQAGHPGARWFLIGTDAAFLLEADVVWTPDQAPAPADCSGAITAELDAAADRAAAAVRAR